MDPAFLGRAAVTLAVLLGSLGFVTWRQSRALETLVAWDEVQRQVSVARAQVVELDREIQVLTSRARVVPEARRRLGMHTPDASELEILELAPVEVAP
jgi:cell division protein FtsB